MNLLVTGATGFLGSRLLSLAAVQNYQLSAIARDTKLSRMKSTHPGVKWHKGDFVSGFDWKEALVDVNCIVHCAARVHQMVEDQESLQLNYDETNFHATVNFAKQAAQAGVERFIFISTIKVNGESTEIGFPFKPDDNHVPNDPYGLSKYKAEVGLLKIAEETGMEVVIIRPPLVYGPGVKANFASMMKWMNKGLPLPLGGIKGNKRSLVSVDNLADLIITCIDHPNAANQIFLVSDDENISTSQLLSNMATALGASNRLLPVPSLFFILVAKLIGKPAISQRLCGSLQVDVAKTKEMLNWYPPYSAAECMKKTANAFLENNSK